MNEREHLILFIDDEADVLRGAQFTMEAATESDRPRHRTMADDLAGILPERAGNHPEQR